MGLHRFKPTPSGRMGILWTLATIKESAIIEFGCMGHMLYSGVTLKHAAVYEGSKMYSTHIDETDIALGRTDRLFTTVESVVQKENPKVIFLLPSSIPEVIGTDFKYLAEALSEKFSQTQFIPFGAGGFNVYQQQGVKETLKTIVEYIPEEIVRFDQPTYNLIGSCADIFRFHEDAEEIKRIMQGAYNMKALCVLTSDTSYSEIVKMGGAHINIVLRHEGIAAAEYLKQKFGTPCVMNRPYGLNGTQKFIKEVEEKLGNKANMDFVENEVERVKRQMDPIIPQFRHLVRAHPEEVTMTLGGHMDVVKGILEYGMDTFHFRKSVCWCDDPTITSGEVVFFDESKWSDEIKNHHEGILMASGEALTWVGKSLDMQISNPDVKWRLHPYGPPFVGFRGAIHLAELWINNIT